MNTPQSGSSSTTRPLLLEMQDIDISFGGVAALRHARLSVSAGEVHALRTERRG
jgi:monosaccharide-transporting ATPase